MNNSTNIARKLKADWMIYLDADEFLIFNDKNMNVKKFLNNYNHADLLGINWLLFGSNNLINDPDGLILDNYTKSEFILNSHIKSFVRPNEIIMSNNPHFYHIKRKMRMYDVLNRVIQEPYSNNNIDLNCKKITAYIAHYVIQCQETFIQRKGRPTDDTGNIRTITESDLKDIHKQHNIYNNFHPKSTYAYKIKDFLAKYNCIY